MTKIRVLVSLSTDHNDFQRAQKTSAEETAARLGVDVEIVHAENDPIIQSQQLIEAIQRRESRPDGIIVQPVGGAEMSQAARLAATAGIGWGILNREPEYIPELRKTHSTPVFAVSSNQKEIGRIQGRQFAALLPNGGKVLYLQGPSATSAASERTIGMNETKPANVSTMVLKGANWTREAGYRVIDTWMRTSTPKPEQIDLIAGQNDPLAVGALQAIQERANSQQKQRWLTLPFLGVDGLPEEGQARVREKSFAATVIVPPNAGQALELMVNAIRTREQPPQTTLTVPLSYPAIEALQAAAHK